MGQKGNDPPNDWLSLSRCLSLDGGAVGEERKYCRPLTVSPSLSFTSAWQSDILSDAFFPRINWRASLLEKYPRFYRIATVLTNNSFSSSLSARLSGTAQQAEQPDYLVEGQSHCNHKPFVSGFVCDQTRLMPRLEFSCSCIILWPSTPPFHQLQSTYPACSDVRQKR
eukprot:1160854-Pelagomonas_calceolata.AAC.3